MLGERTWTSAMSGAATNTVAAGPGSLSAVPLLTSSVSVGASVGTSWLWPNGRPDAPPLTTGAGGAPGPPAGGRGGRRVGGRGRAGGRALGRRTLVGVAHLALRQQQRGLERKAERCGERERPADTTPSRRVGRKGE